MTCSLPELWMHKKPDLGLVSQCVEQDKLMEAGLATAVIVEKIINNTFD